MTDVDRVLWVQAKKDYENARAIAYQIWGNDLANDPAACNAITATLLIHHKDLGKQERIHVKVPPAAGSGAVTSAQSAGGDIPLECPQCHGRVEPNPYKKPDNKAPDYTCLQDNGPCGKRSKDGKYFNKSGIWLEKENPKGAKGNATPVPAGGFDAPPPGLEDETDDLPF
jgi:hypothetical protein